ncbi:MAG: cation transporter [Chloroflexi bacterium]|nr:cation transporter [Chloroflexota bacterium]
MDSHGQFFASKERLLKGNGQRRLAIALLVTAGILMAEVAGGFLANSLALLSDAGHVLTDLVALALSYLAARFATRPATHRRTFGFYRLEILSALANGVTLVVVSLVIFYEAYQRLQAPEPVKGLEVFVIATIGLLGNLLAAWLLGDAGGGLNIRGAMLHVLGDAVSSVGVIIGGLVIIFTGWYLIDPLLSVGIGLLIIFGALRLITEAVDILLEATPKALDLPEMVEEVLGVEGVRDLHDVHVWSITSGLYAMSGHLLIDDMMITGSNQILAKVRELLERKYHIEHTTFQIECEHCGAAEILCGMIGCK